MRGWKICLHKEDWYAVDITTFSDWPNSILWCIKCGGIRKVPHDR